MKVRLTECNKHFVETLDEASRAKITVTDSTIESSDETMHDKLLAYYKKRFRDNNAKLRAETEQLRVEHPEYFE